MSSMISLITERVGSLEASLHALESEQSELHAEIARLRVENQRLTAQNDELSEQCVSLGRETEELQRGASTHQANAERWQSAHRQLRARIEEALTDDSSPSSDNRSFAPASDASSQARANTAGRSEPTREPAPLLDVLEGEVISAESASGGDAPEVPAMAPLYDVVAYPFERFADLRAFQEAIRTLPGTRDVRLRHFDKGTLELRVEYDGETPFGHAISTLRGFPGSVSQDAEGRYAIRVQARESDD